MKSSIYDQKQKLDKQLDHVLNALNQPLAPDKKINMLVAKVATLAKINEIDDAIKYYELVKTN